MHGQYFYNTDFDAKTGWQVQTARGIQQVLISLQFYIDLWRSLQAKPGKLRDRQVR
jgi:hypothetical protein